MLHKFLSQFFGLWACQRVFVLWAFSLGFLPSWKILILFFVSFSSRSWAWFCPRLSVFTPWRNFHGPPHIQAVSARIISFIYFLDPAGVSCLFLYVRFWVNWTNQANEFSRSCSTTIVAPRALWTTVKAVNRWHPQGPSLVLLGMFWEHTAPTRKSSCHPEMY